MGSVTSQAVADASLGDQLERDACMLLSRLSEGGDARLGRRIAEHGVVEVVGEVLRGTSPFPALSARLTGPTDGPLAEVLADLVESDRRSAQRCAARFVCPGDAEWPSQLDDLGDRRPVGIWVSGAANLRLLALRSVSIVGSRSSTSYGEGIARRMAGDLAEAGWLVASGGAFGIDAAAHRGALDAGGATACVLAGGIDVPYPRSHAPLLDRIREDGVLVTETPPGGAAMRQRFLTRNRIIAALTRGTVVVEAALRSGSRTTAREAAELARHVMAVPGPVTSPMSVGCHALIRQQMAVLVCSAAEVISLVGALDPGAEPVEGLGDVGGEPRLPHREARVLDALPRRRGVPLERLSVTAGLGPADVLTSLGILEARGLAQRTDGGWRRRG